MNKIQGVPYPYTVEYAEKFAVTEEGRAKRLREYADDPSRAEFREECLQMAERAERRAFTARRDATEAAGEQK